MVTYLRRSTRWALQKLTRLCVVLVLAQIALLPLGYLFIADWLGPSTYYFNQAVVAPIDDLGLTHVYVGDQLQITAAIIRHKNELTDGYCRLDVHRVREDIGGPNDGDIHVIQHVWQHIEGDDLYHETRWPIAPEKIAITSDWLNGGQSQLVDIFVIGRYYCNVVDYLIPRFLQDNNGWPANAEVRKRRLVGFAVPGWNSTADQEGPHSRIIVEHKPHEHRL